MSPTRIGSMVLVTRSIRATLYWSPTWMSSMFPLGFSVGTPGRAGVEDRHLHLRTGTLVAVDVDLDLAPIEIDVGDVAVGLVEDVLVLVQLVALLANDRLGQLELAVGLFLLLAVLGLEVGDLGGLLVVVGLKLVDLGQRAICRSDSCLLCSASRSALLSAAALAWTSICRSWPRWSSIPGPSGGPRSWRTSRCRAA